ncbi:MAG: HlyD family secretion protein [Cyclobacteriaceae bacterium]|jgi:HlyD family secretion protein
MNKTLYLLLIISTLLSACGETTNSYDATGSFEADETIISAEASGTLLTFIAEEGQQIKKGVLVGTIDTTQLYLSKKQLNAQIAAVLSRKPNISAQLSALNEQLKSAEKEQVRISNLLKADAATPKQLDDVDAQIAIVKANIRATNSTLNTNTESLNQEIGPIKVQIEQINDQIKKSLLINQVAGTILMTYVEPFEQVARGTPLYKIADLTNMTLKVYITGNQLPQIKLNQELKVYTDDGNDGYKETQGTIYWISDKAEFTPKTVQTKDERANKVYAIKVRVKNEGDYKIGMYGEVNF